MVFSGRKESFVFVTSLSFLFLFFLNHFLVTGFFDTSQLELYSGSDYLVHREYAEGIFFSGNQDCSGFDGGCGSQPYLFHLLAAPFSYKDSGFFFFVIFFLGIVFPLTIFFITRQPWSAFFFFTVTDFFWVSRSTLPTITVLWLVLLMFVFKKWWQRGVLLLLCILAHTIGFYLGLGVLFLILFFETGWRSFLPSFLLGCNQKMEGVLNSIMNFEIGRVPSPDHPFNMFVLGDFLAALFWTAPLPFFIAGFWGFFKERSWALLVLLVGCLALIGFTWRFKFFLGLLCVVGVSFAYSRASRRMKIVLLLLALAMGVLQFYNFSWNVHYYLGLIC